MPNEQKRQEELYDQIRSTEANIRELTKERKLYKKLNYHTSNRLVELDTQTHQPVQLRQQMQEK